MPINETPMTDTSNDHRARAPDFAPDSAADSAAGRAPADDGKAGARRAALLAARARHWERTRRLTAVLLTLWLVTTFGTAYHARALATLSLFGWPLSFYFAAQGASLIYLTIIGAYAFCMRRIDRRYHRQLMELA
ncbi:MAG: DUF4212 domain-containing protein [Massilia sp.]